MGYKIREIKKVVPGGTIPFVLQTEEFGIIINQGKVVNPEAWAIIQERKRVQREEAMLAEKARREFFENSGSQPQSNEIERLNKEIAELKALVNKLAKQDDKKPE